MTNKKAASILNKQIVKLEQENFHYPIWDIQTKTYLSEFFGNKSGQHSFFHNHYWNIDSIHTNGVTIEAKKYIASSFLNDCIDTINDIGILKKEPKGNFLTRLPDKWAVSIVLGLIGFAFWMGTLSCKLL